MSEKILKKVRVQENYELPVSQSNIIHIEVVNPKVLEVWYVENESGYKHE